MIIFFDIGMLLLIFCFKEVVVHPDEDLFAKILIIQFLSSEAVLLNREEMVK